MVLYSSAICGAKATTEVTGDATRLQRLRRRGSDFLSAGDRKWFIRQKKKFTIKKCFIENLRLWCIDRENGKLTVDDVIVGKIRREITGMFVNSIDEILYAGTMSGDIFKIRLNCHHDPAVIQREKSPILLGCFARHIAKRPIGKDCEKYKNGVRDLLILQNGNLVIGAGDGTVELVEERNAKFKDYPSPTWPQLKTVCFVFYSNFKLLKRFFMYS